MSLLARCKARSDWLPLPLAALHINCHRVISKIRLTMTRVKMSRADRNPLLAKMSIFVGKILSKIQLVVPESIKENMQTIISTEEFQ